MTSRTTRALLAAACVGCLVLSACTRGGRDEMSWARAALERNAALEIVAADPQARTFTVRTRDGALKVVRVDELVAGPAGSVPAGPPTPAMTVATTTPAPVEAALGATGSSPDTPGETAAPGEVAAPAYQSGGESSPPAPVAFVSQARHQGSPPAPGQVLEKGPGYSIEAGSPPATAATASREPAAGSNVERRHEPIVCQGARLLHIDNQNLQFDGDGLSAEDGCEIHITNSRIRATGFGVLARGANVHIDNSLIEGDAGSIDASDGAQIYAASSRFRGLSRQLDTAAVHDLGGNVWN
jgi:hypothetical protein